MVCQNFNLMSIILIIQMLILDRFQILMKIINVTCFFATMVCIPLLCFNPSKIHALKATKVSNMWHFVYLVRKVYICFLFLILLFFICNVFIISKCI